jgi:hypothetical protein
MSFRRFLYYCTLVGAWAALLGWFVARMLSPAGDILQAAVYGLFLGLTVALGLGLVDALWNFSPSQFVAILTRVAAAAALGAVGGALGGLITGTVFHFLQSWNIPTLFKTLVFLFGWIVLGLLVGVSVSVFDLAAGAARKDLRGPLKKLIKCAVGGTLGGVGGGVLAWLLRFQVGDHLLGDPGGNQLWSPTCYGFVILGGLIGLLVGFSQVILREAWVKVEAGFRPGRDLLITRDRTVIGRAEGSDIALFGDSGVEKQHAAIVLDRGAYYLEPLAAARGTLVNDQPVTARTRLAAGDLIRVGQSVLRFNERRKRTGS